MVSFPHVSPPKPLKSPHMPKTTCRAKSQKEDTVAFQLQVFSIFISLLTWLNLTTENTLLFLHGDAFNIYIVDSDILTLTIQRVRAVHF